MTDPYLVLGLGRDAGDEEIRAAYLAQIRLCPPERDRVRFERLRGAFEAIGTARARAMHALFDHSLPGVAEVVAAALAGGQPRRPSAARLRAVLERK